MDTNKRESHSLWAQSDLSTHMYIASNNNHNNSMMSRNSLRKGLMSAHELRLDGDIARGSTLNPDQDLDILILDFGAAESALKSLYLEAKKIPDTVLCMNKFEKQITNDLSSSGQFKPDSHFKNIIDEWHLFAYQLDQTGEDLVIMLQKVLIGPLKEMKQVFTEMRQAIKHRDNVKNDVIKLQQKVALLSEQEKTGSNLVKLEECKQNLAASQKESIRYSDILHKELRKFLSGIVQLFQPSLEGFMRSEILWTQTYNKLIHGQLNTMTECDRRSMSDMTRSIEERMAKFDSLSICSELT